MRRFDTFGEYMFDLLFAPLKKAKRSVNQFLIFFRVVGREFDDVKRAVFRVRDEANVATASPVMLPVHGQDRDMPRLEGESVDAYRTRLCMKGLVAEWGGTKQGILYALTALGYEQSRIELVALKDPTRWAEFIVFLGHGNKHAVKDLRTLYSEVQRVKEGSSKLAYFVYVDNAPAFSTMYIGTQVASYKSEQLNQPGSIVLIRDREFSPKTFMGVMASTYSENVLVSADELVLVQNRTITHELLIYQSKTSYKEEYIL